MNQNISLNEYKSKVDEEITKLDKELSLLEDEKNKIEEREKYLIRLEVSVPKANAFKLDSGKVLKNLQDLKDALSVMDNKAFKKHVNPEKNDFAAWVRDMIDFDLGNQINSFKKQKTLLQFISKLDRTNIDELIKELVHEEKEICKAEDELLEDEKFLEEDELSEINH